MRLKVILAAIVVVVVVVLAVIWQSSRSAPTALPSVIELTNLPDHYCPTTAAVMVTDLVVTKPQVIFDSSEPVVSCRQIELKNLLGLGNTSRFVLVKLPMAVAFRLQVDSATGHYDSAPSLGDVNGDNIIDTVDEQQVNSALLTADAALIKKDDIDQDGQVSVLDLGLTRINRRAGVDRPDGKSWSLQ